MVPRVTEPERTRAAIGSNTHLAHFSLTSLVYFLNAQIHRQTSQNSVVAIPRLFLFQVLYKINIFQYEIRIPESKSGLFNRKCRILLLKSHRNAKQDFLRVWLLGENRH